MIQSDKMTTEEKVPFAAEISVEDFGKSLHFYTSLGFEVYRIHYEEKFATLMFHGAIFMIWQEKVIKPKGLGVSLRFYMSDNLNELYMQAQALGIKITQPYIKTSYGVDEFCIEDPDGYNLRFCQ